MCKSQSSWFRCRLLTKINSITNVNDLIHVDLIDWGMERQVFLQGLFTIRNQYRLHFLFFLFRSSRNATIVNKILDEN